MLMGKPLVGTTFGKPEVTVFSQPPHHLSRAIPTGVMNFYHPVLVPGGIDNVAIGSQRQRISMQPIVGGFSQVERRATTRAPRTLLVENSLARYIEMVECVPDP